MRTNGACDRRTYLIFRTATWMQTSVFGLHAAFFAVSCMPQFMQNCRVEGRLELYHKDNLLFLFLQEPVGEQV